MEVMSIVVLCNFVDDLLVHEPRVNVSDSISVKVVFLEIGEGFEIRIKTLAILVCEHAREHKNSDPFIDDEITIVGYNEGAGASMMFERMEGRISNLINEDYLMHGRCLLGCCKILHKLSVRREDINQTCFSFCIGGMFCT